MTDSTVSADPDRFAANAEDVPLWLRSLHAALPVATQIVVHGNIRDQHPVPRSSGDLPDFHSTLGAIWEVLSASGFDALAVYSPLDGIQLPEGLRRPEWTVTERIEAGLGLNEPRRRDAGPAEGLDRALTFVQTSGEARLGVVVDYTSQANASDVDTTSGLGLAMLTSLRNVHMDRRFRHDQRREAVRHPVLWLVDRPNDLPHWMLTGDGIRQIPIGLPELETRAVVARVLTPDGFPEDHSARFADATEGLTVRGMIDAAGFVHASSGEDPDIDSAVRAYRVGVSENPWRNRQLREKLQNGIDRIERRVVGQRQAVQRVLDLLVRSAMGLTAAHQAKAASGVRGVLYFAGPTGVGKTEMAKAIAELVFGKDEALIRFDMSEFAQEGSELRLIGSPPGYIGHNAGGELTNAVRQRPFSVVLFDEIDKAHGRILDKFLQILSDGRLTDGSGDTVFFTDTIIVFTSNQGVIDTAGIDTETEAGAVLYQDRIRASVEEFFTHRLNRPELLGRIGDNIIAFRPIAGEFALEIAKRNLENVERRVHQSTGHHLTIDDTVRDALLKTATSDLSKGGRGIGLAIESLFVNPLARELFRLPAGAPANVVGLTVDANGSPQVELGT